MKRTLLLCALSVLLLSAAAFAQEFRSTLTGIVTDPSGAVIPNARLTVTNVATGASTVTKAGPSGSYTVPFLAPGPYKIEAEAPGFQKVQRLGLQLDTGAKVTVNLTLPLGSATQTVTVQAQVPLIDTASADAGQVLTTQEVEDLPSNGRSALGFARDEYGVVPKLKHATSEVRPFDNSGASDFSMGGGNAQSNEIELNGSPNMEDSGRVSAFSPMLDAVDQVRVDEFSSDASMGDTSGGTVDITTKSGTNHFHGSLLEFYETSALAAQPFFSSKSQSTHQNQFGGAIGGPVWIPKVYNGRNKLFFFYAYEGFSTKSPGTTITSVPTQAERSGDFSSLLGVNSNYQLYNPYNSALVKGNVVRQAIPGNNFANAGLSLNPVAQAYLKYVPLPNYNGATTKPDGENNFIANTPTVIDYRSSQGRLDYNVSQADKLTFEIHRSNNNQTSVGVFPNIAEGSTAITNIWGGMLDNVYVFNPKLFLDTRLGFTRYFTQAAIPSQGFNATSLGYPSYVQSSSPFPAMPYVTFSDGAQIPSLSGKPGAMEKFANYQFFTNLTKEWNRHTLKIGTDFRLNKKTQQSPDYSAGRYNFSNGSGNWMTAGTGKPGAPFGDSLAEFMLGLPMSGEYDINNNFLYNNWYFAGYAQDHWKISHELSIDLGLRVEHETPITESNNRAVVAFDPNAVNSATVPAEAAFAADSSKYPATPSSFSPTGGLIYATPGHRSNYSTQAAYISPRIGLAYAPDALHGRTVFRGGMGLFYNPFNDYYTPQSYGYSVVNTFISSNDNMLTPATTLADPFPASQNPLQQPYGNSQGINSYLGQTVVFTNPHPKAAYSIRWSFDIQHDLGHNLLVQIGYIGNHQVHMSYTAPLNYLPPSLLSRSPYYDPAVTSTYGASVANPFYGLISGSSIGTSKKVALSSLYGQFPEYSSSSAEQLIPAASSNMNMLLARVTKRLSSGLTFNVNYEYSRTLAAANPLNSGGPLWYGSNASDFPQHLSVTATYQLPFGRGKWIGNNVNRLTDEIIGGWQVDGIYMYESGTALSWGNVIYTGNWHDFHNTPHNYQHAFNTSVFDQRSSVQPNGYNYRTFPLYALWSDPSNNFDCSLLKNLSVTEKTNLQLRIEAYNALNHPQFSNPNLKPTASTFGESSGQANVPRVIQLGARYVF